MFVTFRTFYIVSSARRDREGDELALPRHDITTVRHRVVVFSTLEKEPFFIFVTANHRDRIGLDGR